MLGTFLMLMSGSQVLVNLYASAQNLDDHGWDFSSFWGRDGLHCFSLAVPVSTWTAVPHVACMTYIMIVRAKVIRHCGDGFNAWPSISGTSSNSKYNAKSTIQREYTSALRVGRLISVKITWARIRVPEFGCVERPRRRDLERWSILTLINQFR